MYFEKKPTEKISIIIPCKNNAKYLKGALECLVNQTYQNLEIICINDHSIDSSLKIMEEYQIKYPHLIKILEMREKTGCAESRNYGLSVATGDYIAFVDADDLVSQNWINDSLSFAKFNNLSLIKTKFERFSNDDYKLFTSQMRGYINSIDLKKNPEKLSGLAPNCWGILYKRELIDNTTFLENCSFEDITFSIYMMLKSHRFIILSQNDYKYRIHANSLSKIADKPSDKILDIITACSELVQRSKRLKLYPLCEYHLKGNILFHILDKYQKINNWKISEEEKRRLKQYFLSLTQIELPDILFYFQKEGVLLYPEITAELEELKPIDKPKEELETTFKFIVDKARKREI